MLTISFKYSRGSINGLHCFTDDCLEDRVVIECPDNTNIACLPHSNEKPVMVRLIMAHSQLMHSEWFVKWFDSPYYLTRGGMKVVWPQDPIACWEMAKSYMEDGHDRFGKNQIATYVCTRFHLADRFMVLVRLMKLAHVLGLSGLTNGAVKVLKQIEHLIAAPNVVTLARYIFGDEECRENILYLKKWCVKWVDKHYEWLAESEQWAKVVKNSVPDLEEEWIRITTLKRIKSQEALRMAIRRNLCESTAIINTMTVVDGEYELPEAADTKYSGIDPDTRMKENVSSVSTTFSRNGAEDRTNKHDQQPVSPCRIQSRSSPNGSRARKCTSNGKDNTPPPIPKKSSLRNFSGEEDCEASKGSSNARKGRYLATLPRESFFQEIFDTDVKHGTVSEQSMEGQQSAKAQTSTTFTIASSLNTSSSEPLLSSHRYGDISIGNKSVDVQYQKEGSCSSLPATVDEKSSQGQEDSSTCGHRGILLTIEALCEPDSWPLADIPLPDPLLPLARRAPSLDSEVAQREQHKALTHNAQAVTVFGIHRPGMGGSIIPIEETVNPSESRARTANEAKAREFLGIDQPVTVGMAISASRSSFESETRKLRKKTLWLVKHG